MDTWSLNEKYQKEVDKINGEISSLKTNFSKLYKHVNSIVKVLRDASENKVNENKVKEKVNAKSKKMQQNVSKRK
tara:strand:+ start:1503 stop:1727 length:225 start_codon:yes stop_codon:yes gene_type:complete